MGGQLKENNLLHYILKFAGDEKKYYIKRGVLNYLWYLHRYFDIV